jgi:hypothetical protein
VEGIKEEVVLSPAHALSLIASGEGTCFYLEDMLYIIQPKFLGQKPLGESDTPALYYLSCTLLYIGNQGLNIRGTFAINPLQQRDIDNQVELNIASEDTFEADHRRRLNRVQSRLLK